MILKNISKSYKKKKVLDSFTAEFNLNTCNVIVGKNGSGKSTLFNIVADLIEPDTGEIIINDINYFNKKNKFKSKFGFLLDETALIEEFSGFEFLQFISKINKVKENKLSDKIKSLLLYLFDKEEEMYKKISSYSIGMKQKIAIAASIIHKPDFLILDEPFTGLDIFTVNKLIELIKEYKKQRIIIFSSHDLTHIEKLADKIIVIDEGKILINSDLAEFTQNGYKLLEESLYELLKEKENNLSSVSWLL